MGSTGTGEQGVRALLTSTESTAGKSLLQLTSSPDSCFHTNPGRARTCVTNTAVFLLNWPGLLVLLLRGLASADRVTNGLLTRNSLPLRAAPINCPIHSYLAKSRQEGFGTYMSRASPVPWPCPRDRAVSRTWNRPYFPTLSTPQTLL